MRSIKANVNLYSSAKQGDYKFISCDIKHTSIIKIKACAGVLNYGAPEDVEYSTKF